MIDHSTSRTTIRQRAEQALFKKITYSKHARPVEAAAISRFSAISLHHNPARPAADSRPEDRG
jgi:hypothetical protein